MAKASQASQKENANFLSEYANDGFENLDSRDFVIPFLRVLQKLSPQVDKDNDEHVEFAEPGLFYNTVNQKIYGKAIQVIPLAYQKIWLEWGPNRGGLIARHDPYSIKVDRSEFSRWRPEHAPENTIVETMCFFVLVVGHFQDGPLLFPLSKTGIKHGRNWNTNIMMTRLPNGQRAPYYSSVWKMETVLNKNDQGAWYQIGGRKTAVSRIRFITPKEFNDYVLPIKNSLEQIVKQADFAQIGEDGGEEEGSIPKGKSPVPF